MTSRRSALIAGASAAAGIAGGYAWWRGQKPAVTEAPPTPAFKPDAAFPNPLRVPGADGLYGIHDVTDAFTLAAKLGDAVTLASVTFDPMENEDGPKDKTKPAEKDKDAKPEGKGAHAMHGAKPEKGAAPADAKTAEKDKSDIPEPGVAMEILRIHVRRKEAYDRAVPATLSRIAPVAANCASPRLIHLDHVKMVWRINGLRRIQV